MLVTTSKVGETLVLGNGVRLKVLRVKGKSRVSLGIESPDPITGLERGRQAAAPETAKEQG